MARLRAERASLLVLVLGAFALRMALLQDQSLWPDEGISWYLAVRPEAFPQADHPPLYFLALAGWVRLAGDSVLALRFFSVLPDVLLVAFLWRWGRRLGSSPAAGWGAALLWAASPLAVWYATEVRGYTWLALFGMLASYLLFIGGRPATYFLAGAAALLVHPFAAFLLGGHGWILWARWRCGNLARRWVGAWLSLPLAMIPWAVQAVRQMGNPTYWPGAFDPGEAVLGTLGTWVAGPSWAGDPTARQAGMALLAVAALGAWAWAFRQRRPLGSVPAGWALWGLLGFPLLGAGALAFVWPKYAPRYLMFLFPLGMWLVAEAAAWTLRRRWWAVAGAVLVMGAVGFQGWALLRTAQDPALRRPDFARALAYVRERARADDALILVGGHTESVVRYYLRDTLEVYPLPPGMLVQVTQPLNASQVAGALNGIARRHPRAWLLLWQEDLADPLRLTLTYLLGGARRREVRADFEHVALLLFAFPREAWFDPAPTGQHRLEVPFQDNLVLRGFDLTRDGFWFERRQTELQGGPPFTGEWPSFRQGESLYVALYWWVEGPVARDYTAFVQVLDPKGRWAAGADHPLGDDRFPATWWRPGETYPQYHALALPQDLPPGEYTVIAGLYWRDAEGTIRRLPRADGGEQVVLGKVRVSP